MYIDYFNPFTSKTYIGPTSAHRRVRPSLVRGPRATPTSSGAPGQGNRSRPSSPGQLSVELSRLVQHVAAAVCSVHRCSVCGPSACMFSKTRAFRAQHSTAPFTPLGASCETRSCAQPTNLWDWVDLAAHRCTSGSTTVVILMAIHDKDASSARALWLCRRRLTPYRGARGSTRSGGLVQEDFCARGGLVFLRIHPS